jgi:3-phosphoshikimate 1-carboxyvinyltransferase
VRHAPLAGIEIPLDQVPLAIDEFPVLFIAAACATGRTVLRGAEELRVKESDRIAAMAEGLTTLGVHNEVLEDGIIIDGGSLGGGVIHTYHDHRIAMSFAIAALRASEEIRILDCDPVGTSFPGFDALARGLGLQITARVD